MGGALPLSPAEGVKAMDSFTDNLLYQAGGTVLMCFTYTLLAIACLRRHGIELTRFLRVTVLVALFWVAVAVLYMVYWWRVGEPFQ